MGTSIAGQSPPTPLTPPVASSAGRDGAEPDCSHLLAWAEGRRPPAPHSPTSESPPAPKPLQTGVIKTINTRVDGRRRARGLSRAPSPRKIVASSFFFAPLLSPSLR